MPLHAAQIECSECFSSVYLIREIKVIDDLVDELAKGRKGLV